MITTYAPARAIEILNDLTDADLARELVKKAAEADRIESLTVFRQEKASSAEMAAASNRHERRRATKWEREDRVGRGPKKQKKRKR